MHVHPRTIVAPDRFGHEGRRLAMRASDVLDDVFVQEHVVSHRHQCVKAQINFALTGGGNFVMMHFNRDARLL